MNDGQRLVMIIAALGATLVGGYYALGGGRYEPVAPANPCEVREWRNPSGIEESVEQILLSGLDGAACTIGVTREELALAFATSATLREFGSVQGIDDDRLEDILRDGLRRAVRDAQRAEVIGPVIAVIVGQAVDRVNIDGLIDAYRSGNFDWITGLLG